MARTQAKKGNQGSMDQVTVATSTDKSRAVNRLRDFIASSIDSARRIEQPFYHLQLDRVFPEDVYRPPETWARRAYRNLIHPRREVDRQHPPGESEGSMAWGALLGVCDHLEAAG